MEEARSVGHGRRRGLYLLEISVMNEIALRHHAENLWITIARFLVPIVLAAVVGYGAVKFTEGATQTRLQTLETQHNEQLKTNEKFMTRDEMKIFMDTTSRELTEIHNDVRSIRTDLRKQ
jgi:hypothetical protein